MPAASSNLEDPRLIARCLQGDGDIREELFRRASGPLRRHVCVRLRGQPDREDRAEQIVSDTFVRLWQNDMARLRAYDPARGSLQTYLQCIAEGLIAEDWRKRIVRRTRMERHLDFDPVDRREAQTDLDEEWEQLLVHVTARQRDYLRFDVQRQTAPESYRRPSAKNEKMIKSRIRKKIHDLHGEKRNSEEKDEK